MKERFPSIKKIVLNFLLGISGIIFGGVFMIAGILMFALDFLFQGLEVIFSHLR